MNTGNRVVNDRIRRSATRWRWLRFWQFTGTLGIIGTLFFLLLSLAMAGGVITSSGLASALIALAVFLAVLTWICLGIAVLSKEPSWRWLAGLLERGQPKLLDRVNTLVALEGKRSEPVLGPFYRRIAKQAQGVLKAEPPSPILSPRRALLHWAVFVVLLLATIRICHWLSPWQRLELAKRAKQNVVQPQPPTPSLELTPPPNVVEQKQSWGEVRITDPARDLQVTKVDVVPLQIEAAANESLQKVGWQSAINGAKEQTHELPPPTEPRYAVYKPMLFLDEYKLADWDVMTYYAKARTQGSNAFASDVYFLEVRPFREDILKMPGGENGKAMQCLNELSALISQQQHVIRQTHQHVQSPPETPKVREQDRRKLADGETDLSQAVGHLYAKLAGEMENKPIGEALDHLAKAEKTTEQAGQSLRNDALNDAQNQERSGLADLAAARKAFHKVVTENAKDFEDNPPEEVPPPTAQKDKLKEIAEFRNDEKAAQDFLGKLVQKQTALSKNLKTNSFANILNASREETSIQQSLEQFQQEYPQVFKPVQSEADAAHQSVEKAAQSLKQFDKNAKPQVEDATRKLQQLADTMKEKSAGRQIADAYKLKELLNQEIQKFGQCQNPGSGSGPSAAEMQKTVADTRQTLKQLKTVGGNGAFGPELREALSDPNMMALNWPLNEVERSSSPEERQKAAGQVKDGLEKIGQAFDASQPKALQAAKARAGEQPSDFERGMAQLDSLIKQLEKKPSLPRQDQAKQGQEALYNLQSGLRTVEGGNDRGNQILLRLAKELKDLDPGEHPLDVALLKQLMESLQSFSVEVYAQKDKKPNPPEVTEFDPSRLPPAYRGRIEKYFQKLSEK